VRRRTRFSAPRTASRGQARPASDADADGETRRRGGWFVGDDHDLRFLVRRWVESVGFLVREAESAEEALDDMRQSPSGIAFCDVNMVGQSGIWLASQLREHYPHTAIIMATAARDVDTAVSSLRNDVIDYDSMTQPHTQRPALPPSMAIEEIERCSSRQFDPSCAEALGAVFRSAAA
jgi:FixJ family two-component response regulator